MKDKTPTIDKVTSFTQACEEITEELTRSAGMIVTKITPLLAPVASGLCTLFAFYDGGGKMLTGKVDNPYLVSFLVGLVLFLVVEGINFAVQFNRDRAEKLKAQYADQLKFVKLDSLVVWCFLLTLATIAMLETIPGAVAWYLGEIQGSDLGFRIGLLILPFFSKMGANIFSVSMLLDALEGTAAARRQRRLQERRELAELEIDLEEKRQKSAIAIAQLQAETAQRLEIERLKAEAKLNGKTTKSGPVLDRPVIQNRDAILSQNSDIDPILDAKSPTILDENEPTILDPVEKMRQGKQRKIEQRRGDLLKLLRDTELGLPDLADRLGVSVNTVRNDLDALQNAGHAMSVNGVVKLIGE